MVGEQGVDGGFFEQAAPGDGPPVYDHLKKPSIVQRRAGQAGSPCTHGPVGTEGIIGGVFGMLMFLPRTGAVLFPHFDQIGLVFWRKNKSGVVHAKGVEHFGA